MDIPTLSKSGANTVTRLVALVLALAFLIVVAIAAWAHFNPDRSGPVIVERIRNLEEFTAAEATLSQVVVVEDDSKWLPDALSGERVIAVVPGTVRATVDFGDLTKDAIEVNESDAVARTIRIELPKPRLSDVEIDEQAVEFLDRDRGILNRTEDFFAENPTDDNPVYAKAERNLNAAAKKSDLLKRAQTNTEAWLTTFLNASGFDKVNVVWN